MTKKSSDAATKGLQGDMTMKTEVERLNAELLKRGRLPYKKMVRLHYLTKPGGAFTAPELTIKK